MAGLAATLEDAMILPAILLISILTAAFYFCHQRQPIPSNPPIEVFTDLQECRDILNYCKSRYNSKNRLSSQLSRAIVYQRLRAAFGIDNAFTTTNFSRASDFAERVGNRANMRFYRWHLRADELMDKAHSWMYSGFDGKSVPENSSSIRINLTTLVQALTMHAVLRSLCRKEANPDRSDEDELKLIRLISKVWVAAKLDGEPSIRDNYQGFRRYEKNHELQKCLEAVFKVHGDSADNALNFVVHPFEMMWRVVLRLFLEVQFVTGGKDPEWWGFIFKEYVKKPTESQFVLCQTSDAGTVDYDDDDEHYWRDPFIKLCAKALVEEGLRLYPPMRRLYRAHDWSPLQDEEQRQTEESNEELSYRETVASQIKDMDVAVNSPHCRILAADIESSLLNVDIWGAETHQFNPARWYKMTKDQKKRLIYEPPMTFGSDRNTCPAKEVYGPRMIGILVGALLVGLEGKDDSAKMSWRLECRDPKVMAELEARGRLRLERDAYEDLMLVGTRWRRTGR